MILLNISYSIRLNRNRLGALVSKLETTIKIKIGALLYNEQHRYAYMKLHCHLHIYSTEFKFTLFGEKNNEAETENIVGGLCPRLERAAFFKCQNSCSNKDQDDNINNPEVAVRSEMIIDKPA
jgi:hypothetical protein